jgi:hypothetical protein
MKSVDNLDKLDNQPEKQSELGHNNNNLSKLSKPLRVRACAREGRPAMRLNEQQRRELIRDCEAAGYEGEEANRQADRIVATMPSLAAAPSSPLKPVGPSKRPSNPGLSRSQSNANRSFYE